MISELFLNFIDLFTESAPWLLLGLLIAGLMKWLVPMDLLKRHMGDKSVTSLTKAAIIGAPLPLCSCGVIPAAVGLRRSGASKPSTVSFLIATPETGVDSISVSYALLGPFMAIIRPFSAIFTAIYTALLVKALDKTTDPNTKELPETATQAEKSCCAGKKTSQEEASSAQTLTLSQKLVELVNFSSGKLLKDITNWLLIGLLLAAIIKTFVANDFLTQWGDGFLAMLIMALVGVPMYICATASTPIAAGFLAVGISPGAVLVFMLAGPATNLSTMGMVKKEMGARVVVAYIIGITSASIGLGYLVNWMIATYGFEVFQVASGEHQMSHSLVYPVSAILLGLMMVRNMVKSYFK